MIRTLLLDLEGVLYQKGQPIAGARESVEALRRSGFALRFLTNTTIKPRRAIIASLAAMGFDAQPDEVFTPPIAASRALRDDQRRRIHLAAAADLAEDFASFALVDDGPDAVVLGDLGPGFTYERLNRLFAMLLAGAPLYALHKNRYWRKENDLILDLGPFVAALEYAAGIDARVMGKPSATFFALALADANAAAAESLMVGDDLDSDIAGAACAGIKGVQVRTGKFRPGDEREGRVRPFGRIDSIADLPALLDRLA
ncbi:MAG TPA: TIGR01458 family HAD-type hydrolase [Alphaproteobacteria bacterium]|nr:TIGR01458 family HAD-type hydrolase [Alphaproteobacteria bacterium]